MANHLNNVIEGKCPNLWELLQNEGMAHAVRQINHTEELIELVMKECGILENERSHDFYKLFRELLHVQKADTVTELDKYVDNFRSRQNLPLK